MFHAFQDRLAGDDALAPILDLPDDGGQLPPSACAQMLPRLEELVEQWQRTAPDPDPLLPRHTEIATELIAVLRVCVTKDAELSIW
ncbi:hypothetical protein CTZ27_12410 [Streptomyces griseocarneus]|nr:hypothetical protein CTZ27_12410 [Streptomyces griseocarneus]